jgi:hypothetical protein
LRGRLRGSSLSKSCLADRAGLPPAHLDGLAGPFGMEMNRAHQRAARCALPGIVCGPALRPKAQQVLGSPHPCRIARYRPRRGRQRRKSLAAGSPHAALRRVQQARTTWPVCRLPSLGQIIGQATASGDIGRSRVSDFVRDAVRGLDRL